MSKLRSCDVAEDIRQMGRDDFYDNLPQSAGLDFWGPTSAAMRHWVEGWEQAELEAYCNMMAEKDKWLIEQFKRELGA